MEDGNNTLQKHNVLWEVAAMCALILGVSEL